MEIVIQRIRKRNGVVVSTEERATQVALAIAAAGRLTLVAGLLLVA